MKNVERKEEEKNARKLAPLFAWEIFWRNIWLG